MQNEDGTKAIFSFTVEAASYSLNGEYATIAELLFSKRLRSYDALAMRCMYHGPNGYQLSSTPLAIHYNSFLSPNEADGFVGGLYNAGKQQVSFLTLNDGDIFYLWNQSLFNKLNGHNSVVEPGLQIMCNITLLYNGDTVGRTSMNVESGQYGIVSNRSFSVPQTSLTNTSAEIETSLLGYGYDITNRHFLKPGLITVEGKYQPLPTSGGVALHLKLNNAGSLTLNSLSMEFISMFDTVERVSLPWGAYNADKVNIYNLPLQPGDEFYVFEANLLNRRNGGIYSSAEVIGKEFSTLIIIYNNNIRIGSTLLNVTVS